MEPETQAPSRGDSPVTELERTPTEDEHYHSSEEETRLHSAPNKCILVTMMGYCPMKSETCPTCAGQEAAERERMCYEDPIPEEARQLVDELPSWEDAVHLVDPHDDLDEPLAEGLEGIPFAVDEDNADDDGSRGDGDDDDDDIDDAGGEFSDDNGGGGGGGGGLGSHKRYILTIREPQPRRKAARRTSARPPAINDAMLD